MRELLRASALLSAVPLLLLSAAPAYAYVGPGGVISGIGTLLALVAAVVVSLFGFVWYPVKRLMRRGRNTPTKAEPDPNAGDLARE